MRLPPVRRLGAVLICAGSLALAATQGPRRFYVFTPSGSSPAERFDCAAFAVTLQGIVNRGGPELYLLDPQGAADPAKRIDGPAYWLRRFRSKGEWLEHSQVVELRSVVELVRTFRNRLRGLVVWDTATPATLNVATTVAGILDAPVASGELAATLAAQASLKTVLDLRGRFTGAGPASSGSAKCDAYLWAKTQYQDTRQANPGLFGYLLDGAARPRGGLSNLWARDFIVAGRGCVFDLSPWDDEIPQDDPGQTLGTDRKTLMAVLDAAYRQCGRERMIEVIGYPPFPAKYSSMAGGKHHPVHTEWESVNVISRFGGFLNAGSSANMSFHRHFRFGATYRQAPPRPPQAAPPGAVYVAFHQSDYDGASALYERLPVVWDDPERGAVPLAWGVNPNLIRNYPDVMDYVMRTRTPQDILVADASGAGYVNPNSLPSLPVWQQHCREYYRALDITLSPMVLDYDQPTPAVKAAYRDFSPRGMGLIVMDLHREGGKPPVPHLFQGMPVIKMDNLSGTKFQDAPVVAEALLALLEKEKDRDPPFFYIRTVWNRPSLIREVGQQVTRRSPRPVVVLDPYSFFELLRRRLAKEE